ncbi:MAG: O-antigen ligase family protein [Syntrophaceae bacterium]|nr:O-antigen ligase family protein [Syntrophaceae bacterium]
MSTALWIPTIWILYIASKPLAVWFGSSGDVGDGSPLDRLFLIALLFLALFILVRRKFRWSNAIKENTFLILLISYMFVSVFWSEIPFISFKRWIRELQAVIMAFVVVTEPDIRKALQCIFRRIIYILIPYSLLLIKYYPHYGVKYGRWSGKLMWIGVSLQKNGLALLCIFTFFFITWTLVRRRNGNDIAVAWYQTHVEVFLLILTIWLFTGPQHILTYSATSTAALAIGLTAFIGFLWMKKRNRVIGVNTLTIIFVLIIIYGTITPFIGRLPLFDVSSTLGREETLTGRADLWEIVLPYAMQKPILGYGFGSFWTDALREEITSNAHNGYLDVILNLGFVGHTLFSMFFLSCCWRAQKVMITIDFDWGCFWVSCLLMAVVHNTAESSFDGFTWLMSAVNLFLAVSYTEIKADTPGIIREKCDFPQHNTA